MLMLNQCLLNGFTGYGSQYGLRALVAYKKIIKNSGRQKIKKVGSGSSPTRRTRLLKLRINGCPSAQRIKDLPFE
jgi:hypothetical protein